MKKALVVNFFAGPGARKSTLAASVYSQLKWDCINCELVTEVAKDLTWEEHTKNSMKLQHMEGIDKLPTVLKPQPKIFGDQVDRLWRLENQVDVIITDSPILQSIAYIGDDRPGLKVAILEEFSQYNNLNVFVNRSAEYNPKGRSQTLEEAKEKDQEIKDMLNKYCVHFIEMEGKQEQVKILTELIKSNYWYDGTN